MLLADCVEGLIWRIDLSEDGLSATAEVWLKHDTMAAGGGHPPVKFSDTQEVPFPGINGLRYGPKTQHVYYATSSQNLFMRVAVDRATLGPAGNPNTSGTSRTWTISSWTRSRASPTSPGTRITRSSACRWSRGPRVRGGPLRPAIPSPTT
jgi:hypothetical protein